MLHETIRRIDEYVLYTHQYDEALELIESLISKLHAENLAYMYYYKAVIFVYKNSHIEDALVSINKACELSPSNIKYTILKKHINAIMENNEVAMQAQIKVFEQMPGVVQGREEEFENGIKYFKEIKQNYDNGEFASKDEIVDFWVEQIKQNPIEEDFDYEDFAENLANQIKDVLPNDISEDKEKYVFNSVKGLTSYIGSRLKYKNGDILNQLVLDDKYWVLQVAAEWIFHKSIDLVRADLPIENCDEILYTLANVVYEAAKQAIEKDYEEGLILTYIKNSIHNIYIKFLKILLDSNDITQEDYDRAILQSNIDLI